MSLLCDNLRIGLRIRPYIERVTQCFNCFMFGHIKTYCKNGVKCIICGKNSHGECTKPMSCRNCGGDHKATFRKCLVFLKNKDIKVIMAYNNISFTEAVKLIKGTADENSSRTYDRYTNPSAWLKLKNLPTNRESNQVDESSNNFSRPIPYTDKIIAKNQKFGNRLEEKRRMW